ncbi:MAG: ABC transporter substrate-binding protein [Flavobacteriaceae bacterium]|nr:ABC transporter substrate-binding protein [Flavobacteriaceae bacterium]
MNRLLLRYLLISLTIILCSSCKRETNDQSLVHEKADNVIKYASGFIITEESKIKILNIRNTFPGSKESYRYALINREDAASITLNKEEFEGVILTPVESVVMTSTTHIPSLELLNVSDRLIGFPGLDYISTPSVRTAIKQGKVRELGSNEGLNTEVLLELSPEVVIGFSVNGSNKTYDLIKRSGIPVLLNGDWVESSPLAKAEWIKFFGLLFEKEKQADSVFNKIENQYLNAKELALKAKNRPTIMSGAVYRDVWYLPNGTSPEAQFLADSNTNYLWSNREGKGSLELSFESVFSKAQDADIWISPSSYKTRQQMLNANPHYGEFKAFQSGDVYSFSNSTGESGGILYYELGTSRPDLVLMDIIKICHPGLLPDYQSTFFKRLQ